VEKKTLKTKKQRKRIREYNKRRKRSHYGLIPQDEPLQLIDGNWSIWVDGYCKTKHGFLTPNLIDCHNCRKCQHYEEEILPFT
jgi:hypothetical protein